MIIYLESFRTILHIKYIKKYATKRIIKIYTTVMDQNKKNIKLKSVCQIPDFPECHIQPFIMEHF